MKQCEGSLGTVEQAEKLRTVIEQSRSVPGCLMHILQEAQAIYGYLPLPVQKEIAEGLNISLSEVYGVATFYSQFSLKPKGKYRVFVCLGTACYVKGSDKILEEVENQLGIKCGDSTDDGLFSLDSCRCVGACGLAPVMMINEDVHGRLKPEMVKGILDSYRRNEEV